MASEAKRTRQVGNVYYADFDRRRREVDFTAPPDEIREFVFLDINGDEVKDPVGYMDRRERFRNHNTRMTDSERMRRCAQKIKWDRMILGLDDDNDGSIST